jgi:hypothetical protein
MDSFFDSLLLKAVYIEIAVCSSVFLLVFPICQDERLALLFVFVLAVLLLRPVAHFTGIIQALIARAATFHAVSGVIIVQSSVRGGWYIAGIITLIGALIMGFIGSRALSPSVKFATATALVLAQTALLDFVFKLVVWIF